MRRNPASRPLVHTESGLGVFRRHSRHAHSGAVPGPAVWAAAHPGAHGRAPSGTVHEVNDRWLPICGAGLNGWDCRGLQATNQQITCGRCLEGRGHRNPLAGQLELFELNEFARLHSTTSSGEVSGDGVGGGAVQ